MSALRSFLLRSNPLVTSRLRTVRRHVPTHTAILRRNLIAASRRRFSDATNGDQNQPASEAKKHLYLVLDDQKKNYGIYKLDAYADLGDGDVGSDTTSTAPRRLPHPAHIRLEVTENDSAAQFAAAGSCIVATGRSPYQGLSHSDDYGVVTILYDIKTPALSVSTHPTMFLQYGYVVAVPVGNRLYVFDSSTSSDDSFHCMTTAKDGEDDAADGEVKQRDWVWWYDSGSSRIGWSDSSEASYRPNELPFSTREIQAHAVHPRDCTIFLSAPSYERPAGWRCGVVTFAFDTTGDSYKWTHCGQWALPFKGHAHYDRQLNKWVGLHGDDKHEETTGYLSACDLPSSEHNDCPPEPEWTSSMEKIPPDDPDRRRVDFKLVYMAERAEYCLFERLRPEGADADEKKSIADGEECVLRLTSFRLKYECDEPDYLKIMDRRARSYKVSRYRKDFKAQAFWI